MKLMGSSAHSTQFRSGLNWCATCTPFYCICPVGLLSEKLGDLGEKRFDRPIKPPCRLDHPLRSLKYLIL
ncbi:MAG: hypothetical protein KJ645_08920 [Planctomycetes bacterium]|nr:hypothetical protein [Planctomycetota bacterium]